MTVEATQGTVTVTIDGFEIRVPKGTLVIRAAELLGIQIPRFCDHPLLDPIGACRQCLVEVEGQRKPLASCTTACAEGKPFNSYFSGNTVQVCPVGALTGAAYRFRSRPFDLVSVPSVCEHCAAGCQQRTDVRRGRVLRRLAGEDPAVNEEWNCDKGRWAFTYATQPDRLTTPLVRDENGMLVPASWPHALAVAADGLEAARDADPAAGAATGAARGVGVLTG